MNLPSHPNAKRPTVALRHSNVLAEAARRARRWRRLPVALACVAVCTAALPAALEWTGNAPVYIVRGDFGNGFTSMEFEHFLDWQGFCNSHTTATCSNVTYWDLGANWTGGAVPIFLDTLVTPVGSTIVLNNYNSVYHGPIVGYGEAAYLNAQGTLAVGAGASAKFGAADIANLVFSGLLASDGLIKVSSFSGETGRLLGTGTTRIQSVADQAFNLQVSESQHLIFSGNHAGRTELYGYDQATLVNAGQLSGQANKNFTVYLSGSSNFENSGTLTARGAGVTGSFVRNGVIAASQQNRVHNTGLVEGSFLFSGVRFDNDGDVLLAPGDTFQALADGTHGGRFLADAGSELRFTGRTPAGHVFQPGSSIQSAGTVVFANGNFEVKGGYTASNTVVGAPFANLTFSGAAVNGLGTVSVNDGSELTFATANPVHINRLALTGPTFVTATFATPPGSTVQVAQLRGGGARLLSGTPLVITNLLDLDGGSVTNVDISGALLWASGGIGGSSTVRGTNSWVDGTRSLFGTLTATTDTLWRAGNFNDWSGTFINRPGNTVDMQGDFNIADGPGRFDNAGNFRKSAGSGTATLGVAFDNTGSVVAESGTLVLRGGGWQSGSFVALPGAAIVLGGDLTIASTFTRQGAVGIDAHSLHLLPGAMYTNAQSENLIVRSLLSISESSAFVNAGKAFIGRLELSSSGTCPNNCGNFTNAGLANVPSFDNAGTLVNDPGGKLYFGLSIGATGVNQQGATITNRGELLFNEIRVSNLGQITNHDRLTIGSIGSVTSSGLVTNHSQFANMGSLRLDSSGTFDNRGRFENSGTVLIEPSAKFTGPGGYRQIAGMTTVYGLLQSDQDLHLDGGTLNGPGTVQANFVWGGGTMGPGNSPGVLSIDGNLTVTAAPATSGPLPKLEIEVASPTSFDTLRVTGAVNLNEAVVEFRFLGSYVPKDGDSLTWLQAGSIVDNCRTDGLCTTFSTTGLPRDWEGVARIDGNRMRLEVINEPVALDASSQIMSATALTIAASEIASNWTLDPYATELRSLDNSGALYNRPDAWLAVYDYLHNGVTGLISNRGTIVNSYTLNEGVLRIRPGAEFVNTARFTNTGEVANHGRMSATVLINDAGVFDNSGTLTAFSLTNGNAGRFDNAGTLLLLPSAAVRNEGLFTVAGTVRGGSEIFNAGGRFLVTATGLVQGLGRYRDLQGLTQVDGRLEAGEITLERGSIAGLGTLAGATRFNDQKLLLPAAPGVLTVEGDLSLFYPFSGYEVELSSSGLFTGLHVTGKVHVLNVNRVQFLLVSGYQPQIGDSFEWLVADGGFDGQPTTPYVISVVDASGSSSWLPPQDMAVAYEFGRLTFIAATVPEPATGLLWLSGGAAMMWVAGRRRRDGGDGARRGTCAPSPAGLMRTGAG